MYCIGPSHTRLNVEYKIMNTKAAIYVGTYHKYNNGSIAGAWLNLDDYADESEFYDACRALHHDELDPEYMFQDFEGFPKHLYSECGNITAIYEYINFVNDSHLDQDVIDSALELDIPLESIEDAYVGSYDNDEDFAQQWAEDTGAIQSELQWPYTYIDWQLAARELMYDYNENNGHYFSA